LIGNTPFTLSFSGVLDEGELVSVTHANFVTKNYGRPT
jgi:hypothetical protein